MLRYLLQHLIAVSMILQSTKIRNSDSVFLAIKIATFTLTIFIYLELMLFQIGGDNKIFWFTLAVGTSGGLLVSLLAVGIILLIN
jgi:hypothetical protein